jgi:drug/metabolite transporter (DMT)-like permease
LVGALLLVGAGATWALFTSLGRPIVAAVGARRAIALSSAVALPFIAPIAGAELLLRGIDPGRAVEPATIGAVAYLGLGATAVGWSAWYRGYAAAPPRLAAGVLFLQPLVAALLGVGLLGEVVDASFLAGAALLLGGVALIAREA